MTQVCIVAKVTSDPADGGGGLYRGDRYNS